MARLHGMLLCAVLLGLGGPAAACMNDNESTEHEREFRSQYAGFAGLPSVDRVAYRRSVDHQLLIGAGAVLLIGAFTLAVKRARSGA